MDVIFNPAYLNCGHLMIFRDASDIRPNSTLDVWKDESRTLLCTENEMVETWEYVFAIVIRASLTRRMSLLSNSVG